MKLIFNNFLQTAVKCSDFSNFPDGRMATILHFPFLVIVSPLRNSGPCDSFDYLGHAKNIDDDDDDDVQQVDLVVNYSVLRSVTLRLLRMHQIQTIATNDRIVCPSVTRLNWASLCKNGWMDQDPVWGKQSYAPKKHRVRRGSTVNPLYTPRNTVLDGVHCEPHCEPTIYPKKHRVRRGSTVNRL